MTSEMIEGGSILSSYNIKRTALDRHAQCVRIPAEVISPGVLLAKLNIII